LQPVCIIDDDESVRTATMCFVRSLGYVAHAFASAEEFLQSPYLAETACLIVDVHMPRMSGLDLQGRLRAEGLRIPIIFITAYPEERTKARALDAGAICFLDKPFDSETLIKCIGVALSQKSDATPNDRASRSVTP